MSNVYLETKTCVVCGKRGKVTIPESAYRKLVEGGPGTYIQDVLPDMSAGSREQLNSGTHPACRNALWAESEDN
jgi:hypothetical protein